MIVIQVIHTRWTKQARGGRLAALRNRLPKELPIFTGESVSDLLLQRIDFSDADSFSNPKQSVTALPREPSHWSEGNSEVHWLADSVQLHYRYQTGAPKQLFFRKGGGATAAHHVIGIIPGHWGSIEYNQRHTDLDTGQWWYEHVVVNVASGNTIQEDYFLRMAPIERYRRISLLW